MQFVHTRVQFFVRQNPRLSDYAERVANGPQWADDALARFFSAGRTSGYYQPKGADVEPLRRGPKSSW